MKSDGESKAISSAKITIRKFDDGTIRPSVDNRGLHYYEIIGMLELIKIELAQKSWDLAKKIRGEQQ